MAPSEQDELALVIADIYEAAGVVRRWGERTAGADGQTQARWQLLSVLSVGRWTVPGAADRLGTSRQAVQRIANALVAEELAVCTANPRNRRSPYVSLTPTGHAVLKSINRRAARRHQAIGAALADTDLAALRISLQQIIGAVRQDLDAP